LIQAILKPRQLHNLDITCFGLFDFGGRLRKVDIVGDEVGSLRIDRLAQRSAESIDEVVLYGWLGEPGKCATQGDGTAVQWWSCLGCLSAALFGRHRNFEVLVLEVKCATPVLEMQLSQIHRQTRRIEKNSMLLTCFVDVKKGSREYRDLKGNSVTCCSLSTTVAILPAAAWCFLVVAW
jgi:hypothetical protein